MDPSTTKRRAETAAGDAGGSESVSSTGAPGAAARDLALPAAIERAAWSALPDATLVVDARGIVVLASDSVERVFGWTPGDLVGRSVRALLPAPSGGRDGVPAADDPWTSIAGEFARTHRLELCRRDGRTFPGEVSLAPVALPSGGEACTVAAFRAAADPGELRTLAELGKMAGQIAHDIKNPIAAVNAALRAVADALGEDQEEVLEDLARRMRRLQQTLARALAYAQPLQTRLEPLELGALLGRVALGQADAIAARRAQVSNESTPPELGLLADRALLEDALAGLLENALDAIAPGGRVRISARRRDAGAIEIAVEDDGPGLPAPIRSELFRPFVTTKPGRTGLGLATCRKVVDAHGGRVEVERSPWGGARVRIDLPSPSE